MAPVTMNAVRMIQLGRGNLSMTSSFSREAVVPPANLQAILDAVHSPLNLSTRIRLRRTVMIPCHRLLFRWLQGLGRLDTERLGRSLS